VRNEPIRPGHSGRKAEELIGETDFTCHAGLCQDAVTAADHAHDLKPFRVAEAVLIF
jgi:hypothetical protein